MKNDEFSFFNQQLASMVRDGIPLESALRRLCADMRQSPLRAELEKLEADLAKGAPLREAAARRQLPDLYRQMLEVGAQSNNLPAVLTMLADHYQRRHVVWTRLKGLMVYPMIVLIGSFLLSCFLAFLLSKMALSVDLSGFGGFGVYPGVYSYPAANVYAAIWAAPVLIGLAVVIVCAAVTMPGFRCALRWRLPAFREASLAQVASALALMLKSGVPLDQALALMQQLERGTPAGNEISHWRERLASGLGKFDEMAYGGKIFPPLFVWTVAQSHEDLAGGFQRAAEAFQSRASYRTEMLLYSALPCSVLLLGMVIVSQIQPVLAEFISFMNFMSNVGG
jgi:type II secretory pathway component PulF